MLTTEPVAPDSTHRARRNGKIARLPKKLRDLINQLLADGLTYGEIIQRLNQSVDPPLPTEITEKNLSTWHSGGFKDWEQHQEHLQMLSAKLDFALHLAQSTSPEKLQELALHLAGLRLVEFLSDLAIGNPDLDPLVYPRLLATVPRIARESLNLQKYRDSLATKPRTPSLSDAEQTQTLRTALLDKMDDIMGLKSYRTPSPAAPVATTPNHDDPSPVPPSTPPPTETPDHRPTESPEHRLPDTCGHLPTLPPPPSDSPSPRTCPSCLATLPPLAPTDPLQFWCNHCQAPLPPAACPLTAVL